MKKIFLALCFVTIFLGGCQSTSKNNFVIALNAPIESLDIADLMSTTTATLFGDIYLTLLEVNQDGELVNGLATDIKTSDDGLTYTITLRDDAVWVDNNGQEMANVTANDFVFSWQRMVDPKTGALYSFIFEPIQNASQITAGKKDVNDLGVKAIDDYTLEVKLDRPTPYFKALLAFYTFTAMPVQGYEQYKDEYATSAQTTWYNGAFYVTDYDPSYEVHIEKNELYFDADKVALDSITYKIIEDSASRYNAFKTNEVDYTQLENTSDINDAKENGTLSSYSYAMSWYAVLNHDENSVTSNENLRKALAYGFDREVLEEINYEGYNNPIEYLIPEEITEVAYNGAEYRDYSNDSLIKYNKDKANEYFDKYMNDMGYTDRSQIKLTYLTSDNSDKQKLAESIQANYKQNFGITIDVQTLPSEQYSEARRTGDFDMIITSWLPDYADPSTYLNLWESTNSSNYANYNNPKYDQLLNETLSINDVDQRFTNFAKLEKMLVDDNVIIPFYQQNIQQVVNQKYNVPTQTLFLIAHKYVTINE